MQGRMLVVKAKYERFNIVFINVYAPNFGPGRVLFLNELSLVLKECVPEDYLFLGGDFNCTANHTRDINHSEPHAPSQKAMLSLINTHSLSDVWRKIHHSTRQYTWVHSRERILSLARLDRFYCFTQHFSSFKRCNICPVGFSDHSMVLCEVFIKNLKSKSAYWHFNTTLLLDAHFREVFIYFWGDFRERKGDFICSKQWWDHGKVQIKQLCQQYTLNVSRDTCSFTAVSTKRMMLHLTHSIRTCPQCQKRLTGSWRGP